MDPSNFALRKMPCINTKKPPTDKIDGLFLFSTLILTSVRSMDNIVIRPLLFTKLLLARGVSSVPRILESIRGFALKSALSID